MDPRCRCARERLFLHSQTTRARNRESRGATLPRSSQCQRRVRRSTPLPRGLPPPRQSTRSWRCQASSSLALTAAASQHVLHPFLAVGPATKQPITWPRFTERLDEAILHAPIIRFYDTTGLRSISIKAWRARPPGPGGPILPATLRRVRIPYAQVSVV